MEDSISIGLPLASCAEALVGAVPVHGVESCSLRATDPDESMRVVIVWLGNRR
jgi:hypothetical protein